MQVPPALPFTTLNREQRPRQFSQRPTADVDYLGQQNSTLVANGFHPSSKKVEPTVVDLPSFAAPLNQNKLGAGFDEALTTPARERSMKLPWYSAPGQYFNHRKSRRLGNLRDAAPQLDPLKTEENSYNVETETSNTGNGGTFANGFSPEARDARDGKPTISPKGVRSIQPAVPLPYIDVAAISGVSKSDMKGQETTASHRVSPPPTPVVPTPTQPRSWAALLKPTSSPGPSLQTTDDYDLNEHVTTASPFAGVLRLFEVDLNGERYPNVHLEPRGLINTGNMCFMNVVSITCRFAS